jgi:hypothetical protein
MAHDDDDIWFPAKRYGWGWGFPRTWQGWLTIGLYLVMLLIGGTSIDPERQTALFLAWMGGWSLALGVVCYLKGERPRWRWGSRR